MINIDQLHHLKISWTHTCASSVTLTQYLTSGGQWWHLGQIGTQSSKTVVGIAATPKLWIQDMDYDQYRPATPFIISLTHTCASSVTLTRFLTSGKWWLLGQIGTQSSKTVVGIAATAKWEFRTWIMININQLRHFKICWNSYMCFFTHFDYIPHKWQTVASGSNRNTKQQNSDGHYSNHQIVNSGHGLLSIQTSYTIWHTAGTHTCASSVTLTWFLTGGKCFVCMKILLLILSLIVIEITVDTQLILMQVDCTTDAWFFVVVYVYSMYLVKCLHSI
jgi:hypothetical protein